MFGNWTNVRIRTAEKALKQGRFDEAWACASRPEVQQESRGQRLLDELVRPLLARARLNAQAGAYREALDDLDRLAAVGRGGADADALRRRVVAELKEKHDRRAEAHDAVARATDDLKAGRLESGRLAIDRVDDSVRREQLQEELDARVQRSARLLEQAEAALAASDVHAAARFWEEAVTRHGRTAASDAFAVRLSAVARQELDAWLADGRLQRVEAGLSGLAALRKVDPGLTEIGGLLEICRAAAGCVQRGEWAGMRAALLRLISARGELRWVRAALDAAAEVAAAHERLLTSPLGALAPLDAPARRLNDANRETAAGEAWGARMADGAWTLRGEPRLLLVDGAGSNLLVFRDTVRIGRLKGDAGVDVPIPGDVHSHHADVVRDGDDYFLVAHAAARVNGREVRRILLRDGDRITLGSNGRFTFRKPSAKSGTAVLALSDRCRLPQDVSQVLLFRDACVIGPQLHAHIRTREGATRAVLYEQDGGLRVRPTTAEGRPAGASELLVLRKSQDVGDVRLTLTEYDPGDSGRRA